MPSLPEGADVSTLEELVPATVKAEEELPMCQEWAYDFEKNELLLDENGMPYLVSGNAALKIWLYWAVTTPLNRYRANSRDYGTEIDRMMGLPVTTAIKSSELERTIREAVEISPYVKEIDSIELSLEDGIVTAEVTIKSIYQGGWVSINVEV